MIGFWVKVANKVHIAYWPVTPFAEKQKYAPGAWARVYAPLSLSQSHKNQPTQMPYARYVGYHIEMSKYADLNIDLSKAGLPSFSHMDEVGDPIDTLVNTKTSSKPYLSILLEYLPKLYGNEQEMVIRALSEKGNTDATPYLLDLLSNPTSSTEINLWAIGNALNAIDDKNSYPDIIKLCKNTQLGSARQMLFEIIARIKTEEVFQIIVDSVTDQSVQLHAIQALGKYGDQRGIIILEQIDSKKNKHIEQAVNKAIEKLKLK